MMEWLWQQGPGTASSKPKTKASSRWMSWQLKHHSNSEGTDILPISILTWTPTLPSELQRGNLSLPLTDETKSTIPIKRRVAVLQTKIVLYFQGHCLVFLVYFFIFFFFLISGEFLKEILQ